MLRNALIACGLLLAAEPLLAQSGPTAPTPTEQSVVAPMEQAQIGDHWTYEVRDEIAGTIKATTTNTVTDLSASEVSTSVGIVGKPSAGYQTFDRSWNLTSNGVWRFSPNDGTGIRLPLAVGKTWSFKTSETNSSADISSKRSGSSKVVAQESVTTRAGIFDTFKIETSVQVQNSKNPTQKYQVSTQTWYAPLINHWVKRTYVMRFEGRVRENTVAELVEYGRR